MELNTKNNVWLFFYRFWTGNENELPSNICNLFWVGLLGGFIFITSPFYLITLVANYFYEKKERTLLEVRCDITASDGINVFFADKILLLIWLFLNVAGSAILLTFMPIEEPPLHFLLWSWLIPAAIITIIVYAAKNYELSLPKTKRKRKPSVIRERYRNWKDKNCTIITWKEN